MDYYVAYVVFVGLPNVSKPAEEKDLLVVTKNNKTEEEVIKQVEKLFPGKTVLNIGLMKKEIVVI